MNLRKAVYRGVFFELIGGIFIGLGLMAVVYAWTYREIPGWSDAAPRLYIEGSAAIIAGTIIAAIAFSAVRRIATQVNQ